VAGRPEEYFWRDNEPLYRARWHVSSYRDYLERALSEGTTPNGIFGAKVHAGVYLSHFIEQLQSVAPFNAPQHSLFSVLRAVFPALKFIWLTRRNKVRQAVSWWKAVQSQEWVRHTPDARTPAQPLMYHFTAIDQLVNESLMREAAWDAFFTEWHIRPLTLVYEDFIEDYAGTVAQVLDYLEVRATYRLDDTAITLRRQADSLSEVWVQQYREEKQQHWSNRAW
jgi:LPS sulfotransferase NodH